MTKRNTPDSGFDTTNSPKRQLSNGAPTSHSNVPAQPSLPTTSASRTAELPLHPSSSTATKNSIKPNALNGTESRYDAPDSSSHERSDDLFLPPLEPEDSVKELDEFVPSDNQRNEIAAELAHLQANPTDTVDEVFSPSNQIDQQVDNSQQDEQPISQSLGAKKKKNKKKPKGKHIRKPYIDPWFWPEGLPDREAQYIARQSDCLVCGTTNISLDTEPLLVNGTVWKEILQDELPELLRSNEKDPLLPEQDSFDFLKACVRLGSFMEPTQLSRLLGGGYRSPEYCSFVLQGFLGLLHDRKVRRVLRGDSPEHVPNGHTDVVVNADQLYPSDDELIKDQEATTATSVEELPDSAEAEVIIIEESDREEDEGHKDPVHVCKSAVHEFGQKDSAEDRFLASPSYVLRNYMSIVCGRGIRDIDAFGSFITELGATFRHDPRQESPSRLKWLKEKMPAPNMGREVAVSEPLHMWRHASKRYSRRNLARCALIKTNSLLDWLGFVANETTTVISEKEFFEEKRPVVAVAPVPTLYLADRAIDFVLRVLTLAIQTEELSWDTVEAETDHILIDGHDVTDAASEIVDDPYMKRGLIMSQFMDVLGNEDSHNTEWPSLLQRPMSGCETIELCNRTPKACISVPTVVMEEMRAVVMSFRQLVKGRIYAKPGLMKAKDPLLYMSGPERTASSNIRRQRNHAYGINRHKTAEGRLAGEKKGDEDIASQHKNELQERTSPSVIPGREDDLKNAQPAGDKEESTNPDPRRTHTMKLGEKLPNFFDQVNFAEWTAFRLGKEEIQKRKDAANKQEFKDPTDSCGDAAELLKEIEDGTTCTTSTVCFHRLGWICLHALGISLEKHEGDIQPVRYGSLTNYTNFAQLRGEKPVVLTKRALSCLARMADTIVRSEGEILMSCAAHDEGRPWIDRADVALVTSVRKEPFHYSDL